MRELLQIQNSCKMAKAIPHCDLLEEEEGYIDMVISSAMDEDATSSFTTSNFLRGAVSSPPHAKEFEFRTGANSPWAEAATCPADELFHEGKLLPLHHALLEKKPSKLSSCAFEKFATAQATAASTPEITPFESCNMSPTSSCFVSGELNAEDYFSECSSAQNRPDHKRSWSKKLKLIKQSSVALKLKASRDFLKSLFTKSGNPDQPCTAKSKAKECSDGYTKAVSLNPLSQIQMKRYLFDDSTGATSLMKVIEREKMMEEESVHRKSFSGAINWNFTTKLSSCSSSVSSSSSSSSSSANSNGFHQLQMLKRSSSCNSESECSIQGAIAHCKKSQQLNSGRKSASDIGFYSLSLQQIAACCTDKEGQGLAGGDEIQLATLHMC